MTSKRPSKKSQSDSTAANASETEQQNNDNKLFPIVAMGASAGGLEAFTELLRNLPTDTGMGFVLIQHLSPNQKSLLSEILGRTTQMPVKEVEQGMTVEPNNVYVIPPNKTMTISQGVLQLIPRERVRGLSKTVDAFFISLAEERGSKAIGVVLSGGDADGAQGLEEIKAVGGITFAQCEDSAKVSSMPNTAVASGNVDFILTPQAIAQELAKLSSHPYVKHLSIEKPSEIIPESEDALSTIFRLLKTATAVDFSHYKQTTLKRRILRRMILYKLERLEDYVQYLQENSGEVNALYQDVLITVTSFFRDAEAFEALKTKVFPVIVKGRTPDSPIRIWVTGCSTGEEAYSIAICLLEYLSEQGINPSIQIFATDINEVAIDKARLGVYKPSQIAQVSRERLQRFFVQVEDGYQISKPVRELCVFARQNLINDPPFSRLDLITCRNVLIYLNAAVQKKLLPVFHYGLKPTSFLMLGTSETVGEFSDLFSLIDRKYKIYARKIAPARLGIDLINSSYPKEPANSQPTVNEEEWNDLEIHKEADRIILNRYAPASVIINNDLEIIQFRGQTSPFLQPAPGKASLNLLKMAKEGLRLELRTAVHQAKKRDEAVTKEGIQIREDDQLRQIKIDVIPLQPPLVGERYFLVIFEDVLEVETAVTEVAKPVKNTSKRQPTAQQQENTQLKQELATTKEYLQSIIEEQQATNQDLRAANEEILSSNEELQSTNEELETAKEEIQATNEELNTINDELQRRNIESTQVGNDLQNLLSSINIPILMLGGDLRIRRFTPVAGEIFNLISTDVGRPLSDINHNLNLPDLEEQILEVINTLNHKAQEVQNQQGYWYDMRIRPYRTIDNKIDGAVVVLIDINALKHSVDQLKVSRNYTEAIVDSVRESLLVLDLDLQVIRANRSFYETFRLVSAEIEQRTIFEIRDGQWDIPELRSLLENLHPSEVSFQDIEVEHHFENGLKTVRFNARRMPQIDEDMPVILLMIEDITHPKQLEAERTRLLDQEQSARTAAEIANRAKDEFISVLSHELRNPLNLLLGWAKLLRSQRLDQARTQQALEAIERSAKAQAQLVEDLLDISRITAGRLRLNTYPIGLTSTIEAAIEVIRLAAEAKNIQLETRLNPSPSTKTVLGDPSRLQQVMWNLLSNAIKFTPIDGKIEVTLEYTDLQAKIQVSDTGQGINQDFLPFIFERFRQADGSRTRSNPGLGLGLSIVRHLIELHGGTIVAQSEGVGQGATFIVRLPLQVDLEESDLPSTIEPVAAIEQPEEAIDNIPSVEGLRVLVVDDETDIRDLFITVLEQYGVEVTAVASVREALSRLIANPRGYDVLLSDIGMPDEDGYALIRQVRALTPEAGGQIPAAVLTAFASQEERREALSAGFQMHLAKPVDPDQLLFLIASLGRRTRNI
ncbi:chemotaxis protein CheB [Nostoc sp. ChiQUE01b]|uniref:chemotaxis protein CheB n=1 Tax=Nostoc sp. ChiQUE01b TaxID=3075376 RepID=UPI002AD4D9EA|nr:chemotaxis protein CheB [Nostoc sp. ChiQUE01b]MDZ8258461.1 chemotaxis protein CheB [Nostoc sp. ChiQUE01b]